jgi:hypothetical protein
MELAHLVLQKGDLSHIAEHLCVHVAENAAFSLLKPYTFNLRAYKTPAHPQDAFSVHIARPEYVWLRPSSAYRDLGHSAMRH